MARVTIRYMGSPEEFINAVGKTHRILTEKGIDISEFESEYNQNTSKVNGRATFYFKWKPKLPQKSELEKMLKKLNLYDINTTSW